MRAATNLDRAEPDLAPVPSFVIALVGIVACLLLAALWWLWPLVAAAVGLVLLVGCGWQIVTLRRKVRELADRDPLTGVASRAFFSSALRRAVEERSRSDSSVSVAVLDCDDFKQLNERYGHAVGDSVLIEVASVLAQNVGKSGTVGRIWGDAFGILLPKASQEAARSLLQEAQQRLQVSMSAHNWPVTFSIGISSVGGTIATGEELLSSADGLMFAVKRRGRNGIACRGQCGETNALTPQPSPEFARQP
jgi:diguanylate cyclase (GGDEF)-like protein